MEIREKNKTSALTLRKKAWYALLFLFLMAWQWNGKIMPLWGGFDAGIQNWETVVANESRLRFGMEFPKAIYSVLGFLYKGILLPVENDYGIALFKSVGINVVIMTVRVLLISYFAEGLRTKSKRFASAAAILMLVFKVNLTVREDIPNLIMLLTMVQICEIYRATGDKLGASPRRLMTMISFAGVLLAVPGYVKFSYLAISTVSFALLTVLLCVRRRLVFLPALIVSFMTALLGIWTICGEDVRYLLPWMRTMLAFSSGYSETFSLDFSYGPAFPAFISAIVFCVFYGVTLIFLLVRRREYAFPWFLIAPFIFMSWKESFVRSDMHVVSFQHATVYIVIYLLYVITTIWEDAESVEKEKDSLVKNASLSLCVLYSAVMLFPVFAGSDWMPTTTLYSDMLNEAAPLHSKDNFEKVVQEQRKALCNTPLYQELSQMIEPYPEETLCMLTGDQSFLIARELVDRSRTMPAVSMWDNNSPEIERASADFFYGSEAPDLVLDRPEPFDGSYFVFKMGNIFQALLENYRVNDLNANGYLLLHKNEQIKREWFALGEEQVVEVNSQIDIPRLEDAYVFMRVDWELTPLGKLAAFILKPTQTKVEITTTNGWSNEYRFYRSSAKNGIYVSNLILNSEQMKDVYCGDTVTNAIQSIRIMGDRCYKKSFRVSFYAVPFSQTQIEYKRSHNNQTYTATFANEIPAGNYDFFWGNDLNFGNHYMRAVVPKGERQVSFTVIDEGWDYFRLDFPEEATEYDLLSSMVGTWDTSVEFGHDVVITQTAEGYHISTGSTDPFVVFKSNGPEPEEKAAAQ